MADDQPNPFGLSLWGKKEDEKLTLDPRGTSTSGKSFTEYKSTVRGTARPYPSLADQGLALNSMPHPVYFPPSPERAYLPANDVLKNPSVYPTLPALRKPPTREELEKTMELNIFPKIIIKPDLLEAQFGPDEKLLVNKFLPYISEVAREFKINPGEILEHIRGEIKGETKESIVQGVPVKLYTGDFGLDDLLTEEGKVKPEILKSVPRAADLGLTGDVSHFVVEKTADAAVPVRKPAKQFTNLRAAARGAAAYLKFKENQERRRLTEKGGDFDALPVEVQFQLTRRAIQPGSILGKLEQFAVKGDYAKLFNLKPLGLLEYRAKDIKHIKLTNRATVHTAFAVKFWNDLFEGKGYPAWWR